MSITARTRFGVWLSHPRRPRRLLVPSGSWAAVLAWGLVWASPAPAQNVEGEFVTVPNPITTEAVNRIKAQVNARLNDKARSPQVVVFDFNPDGKPAATDEFGAALTLQSFILEVSRAKTTVAYVRDKVSAHTVLPVLACRELVMSRNASIGQVVGEGVPPFGENDSKKIIYRETLAAVSRGGLDAVVRKMYDPGVKLRKGRDRNPPNEWIYIDVGNKAEADRVAGNTDALPPVEGTQDGQVGLFNTRAAKDVGLCTATADTLAEVAELYRLPPLRPDPLLGRTPDVYVWPIQKDIDGAVRESVGRVVRDVKQKGGNVLILVITDGGNDLDAARGLADDLRVAQTGDDAIKVIAFVPEFAKAAGTVVALGCSEIVMSRPKPGAGEAKEAEIGDFSEYLKKARQADADAQLTSVRDLAEKQGYPPLLIDGMFKKDLEIVRAVRADDKRASQRRFMTRDEFDRTHKEGQKVVWVEDKVVKPKNQLLKLTATLAAEYGLARATVEGADAKALTAAYGWPEAKSPDPGWLDRFANFLKQPVVTVLLVVIGFTGLILELKVPGLTVPGIIAALCFILVFWAHSKFGGQTFVLAMLLFLLGLVLVGIEIFVLPGFGAAGIFGILCMLAGLGLVTVEKVPQTGAEWGGLGVRVSWYMFAMMGALLLAFFIARFLPKLPGANRLVLEAPVDTGSAAENLPGAGEAAELLGAIGTTSTPLRPAGVVKFGDKFVDVVSDGGFIPAGTRVQVIQVEGTRIVVKEV